MDKNIRYDNDGNVVWSANMESAEDVAVDTAIEQDASDPALTIGYVLKQIEKVQKDSNYLVEMIRNLPTVNVPGALKGVWEIVEAKEKTNRKLLELYEKLLGDLSPNRPAGNNEAAIAHHQSVQMETMLKFAREAMEQNSDFAEAFAEEFGATFRNLFAK